MYLTCGAIQTKYRHFGTIADAGDLSSEQPDIFSLFLYLCRNEHSPQPMSVWRRKALACMPEERIEFEQKQTSIYQVFFSLLHATVEAHKQNDRLKLMSYYAFAEWCFNQNATDLWNAAAVSFYEHLGDQEETFLEMHKWVKKSIYIAVRELLVQRIDEDKIKHLDKSYGRK